MNNIISLYLAADDDDDNKMNILLDIIEDIDLKTYDFFLKELDDKDLDEFVAIEIIKVISLYSPESESEKTIQTLFLLLENNDDDLVRVYALQGLEHLPLMDNHYNTIQKIAKFSPDEDLQATAQMILLRAGKN